MEPDKPPESDDRDAESAAPDPADVDRFKSLAKRLFGVKREDLAEQQQLYEEERVTIRSKPKK